MNIKRFGDFVFIPGLNKARYPFCNSLFIDDEKKVIIDPASNREILEDISGPHGFDVIINSHYHEDHFTYNYLFPEAELYVPEDDAPCFLSLDNLFEFYGVKGTDDEKAWLPVMKNDFNYRERAPDVKFKDGDILNFGKTKLEVIHTPGHTPGHSSFYCADEGLLFMGDLDMSSFGPWYGDRVSDIDLVKKSVKKLLEIPAKIYITSHDMGVIEGDINKLAQSYLHIIDEREEKLMSYLEEPRSFNEIVDQWIIYKRPREPKNFYLFGERAMIKKHLDYLDKKKLIEIIDDKYYIK